MSNKGILLNNLKAHGTLSPAEYRSLYKNAQYSLNTGEDVVVKGCDFGLNGYNCLEIGLKSTPKSVLIENCNFSGTLSNNAILVFDTKDNAVITIRNCHFKKLSNMLRLSNRSASSGITVNVENCEVESYEEDLIWRGLFLFENYTDKTDDDAALNNRFSHDKITINVKNLTSNNQKFNITNMEAVTNMEQEDQMFIFCQDMLSDYIPKLPDMSKLPKVVWEGVVINE